MVRKLTAIVLVLGLLLCCGCSSEQSRWSNESISSLTGVDVSKAETRTVINNYDGGKGACYISMTFGDDACLAQIGNNADWNKLPLTDNLTAIVYGTDSAAPYISFDDSKTAAIPLVENGYYFFADRHGDSSDAKNDGDILNRDSISLTVVIYNTDTNTLYYLDLDT